MKVNYESKRELYQNSLCLFNSMKPAFILDTHEEKPYKCNEYGMVIVFILDTHEEKPYTCNECGMVIANENCFEVICYFTIFILVSHTTYYCGIKYVIYKYSYTQLILRKIHVVKSLCINTTRVIVMCMVVSDLKSSLPKLLYTRICLLTLLPTTAALKSRLNTKLKCPEILVQ